MIARHFNRCWMRNWLAAYWVAIPARFCGCDRDGSGAADDPDAPRGDQHNDERLWGWDVGQQKGNSWKAARADRGVLWGSNSCPRKSQVVGMKWSGREDLNLRPP